MRFILLAIALCLAFTPLDAASRKSHPAKILKPKRNPNARKVQRPPRQHRAPKRAN